MTNQAGPYITVQGVKFNLSDPEQMQEAKDALCLAGELYARIYTSEGVATRRYLAASRYVEFVNLDPKDDEKRCASVLEMPRRFKR